MKNFLVLIIKTYQYVLSPDKGVLVRIGLKKTQTCTFYPSCSEYSIEAVKKYGAIKGAWLGTKRVFRCHPWQKEHVDELK